MRREKRKEGLKTTRVHERASVIREAASLKYRGRWVFAVASPLAARMSRSQSRSFSVLTFDQNRDGPQQSQGLYFC